MAILLIAEHGNDHLSDQTAKALSAALKIGADVDVLVAGSGCAAAADAAVWGGMSNAGQTCVGVERVYVHEAVAEAFTAKVVAKAEALRPGAFGPMTLPTQVDVVRRHLDDALARGFSLTELAPPRGEDDEALRPRMVQQLGGRA